MVADFELLDAWRRGDRKSGDQLFVRHYAVVRRFFLNKASDEVDDLVQKTFMVCVEHPHTFEQRSSFRSFLLGVAYRMLLRFIRDKKRHPTEFDPTKDSVVDAGSGVFTQFVRRREQQILLEGLRRIPIEYQTVLELYYWERLPASECARILEIPEGTIRSRLRRAREMLLAALSNVDATPEERRQTRDNLEHWIGEIREHLNRKQAPNAPEQPDWPPPSGRRGTG